MTKYENSMAYWMDLAEQQLEDTGDDYDEQDVRELAEAMREEDAIED